MKRRLVQTTKSKKYHDCRSGVNRPRDCPAVNSPPSQHVQYVKCLWRSFWAQRHVRNRRKTDRGFQTRLSGPLFDEQSPHHRVLASRRTFNRPRKIGLFILANSKLFPEYGTFGVFWTKNVAPNTMPDLCVGGRPVYCFIGLPCFPIRARQPVDNIVRTL